MMKLVDAVSHRFPQQNEWAQRALASLTDVLEADTPIHELVEGWCRVGSADDAQLIDVLFVLTETRLGIGHAGDLQIERWVDLASVVYVDAIDNSLYPLQTVELQFTNEETLMIGWSPSFSEQFVAVLIRLRDANQERDAAREAEQNAAHDAFFADLEHTPTEPVATPVFEPDNAAPWTTMGNAWPAPIGGTNYLGGHPSVKRKRKGGTLTFTDQAMLVCGKGMGRWAIELDWPHVSSIEVQGADEIMFSEALRVPPSSCVLIVEMTDDVRLFFEVLGRRPPSLRSEIAAVISMVDAGRTYRHVQHNAALASAPDAVSDTPKAESPAADPDETA